MFGRIVKKAGSSLYWDDWSADIAMVTDRYIHSLAHLLEDAERRDPFQQFVGALRDPEPGRGQRVSGGDAGPAHPDGPAL